MTDLAFMFSNWYSGATLFAIMLDSNRHVVCNGETFEFEEGDVDKDSYRCSCGEAIPDCPFYREAAAHFWNSNAATAGLFSVLPGAQENPLSRKVLTSFSRLPGWRDMYIRGYPGLKSRLDHYLTLHDTFYQRARSQRDARCYVDGTKSVRRAELFRLYRGKPFKVLHLIRDGRGFAWSYLRNNQMPRSQIDIAAGAWLSYINLVDTFAERYPTVPLQVVRYEDLCHRPEETLRDVCGFLEVEFDPAMLKRPHDYHVLGNQIRHTFDGTVRESLSWKKELSDSDKQRLDSIMGEQLRRFNYV